MTENFKNILIIKPSSLGDIVLALPALSALRRSFPQARISWFVRPEFAALIDKHPHIDNLIIFDRKFLGKAWYHPKAFAALVSLIRKLRKSKFDAVIDLQGLFRTASLGWLSGCKKRFGMSPVREFADIFYTHKVTQTAENINLVDYYLKIVETMSASDIKAEFVLPENSAATDHVNALLADRNIEADNYAVFVPGSAHDDKCWSTENFAALADKISSEFGLRVIATGTASEAGIVENLKKCAKAEVVSFAGQTNIPQLTALLRNAKLVISNDTGPGHIAAALGVPVVLIFGRSNPARVAPYNRKQCVAAIEPDSRGFKPDSTEAKHNIKFVTFDQVYGKVCKQLKARVL